MTSKPLKGGQQTVSRLISKPPVGGKRMKPMAISNIKTTTRVDDSTYSLFTNHLSSGECMPPWTRGNTIFHNHSESGEKFHFYRSQNHQVGGELLTA
jgi:hypothetical protein